jgi:hypothetical protein
LVGIYRTARPARSEGLPEEEEVMRLGWKGRQARDIIRANAYASFACAAILFGVVFSSAQRFGISRVAVVGFAAAILLAAGDEMSLAVGRHLRRRHIVPFALLNAVCSAGCVTLLVAADALSPSARLLIGLAAALFGWFAFLETRAARSL